MEAFLASDNRPRRRFVAHCCIVVLVAAFGIGVRGYAQSGAMGASTEISTTSGTASSNPLFGSVPGSKVTPEVVHLTIKDAIQLALKNNLGLILGGQGNEYARAARIRALSELLPHLNATFNSSVQQVDLAQYGFPPAFTGGKSTIGPYGFYSLQANLSQNIFDYSAIHRAKASSENQNAAKWNYQNTRDLVVLVAGASYLQAAASMSRVDAAQAELNTAQTAYDRAADMRRAGMVPAIEELRAQVELQSQQQRLLAVRNQLERSKLDLARAIGLPVGQQFELADKVPYAPLPPLTLEVELQRAYQYRADYKAIQSQVRSAELQVKAAHGERLPTVGVQTQYGDVGNLTGNHGVFSVAGSVTVPIFQGNIVKGDVLQAETLLKQRQAELEDLRSRIEYDLRTAFLDEQTASQQVAVAESALKVAHEQLVQSQDRFSAGVAGNLEVVQAQQAVAVADENYISSLYAHNYAKLSLARAVGVAEDAVMNYLGGK